MRQTYIKFLSNYSGFAVVDIYKSTYSIQFVKLIFCSFTKLDKVMGLGRQGDGFAQQNYHGYIFGEMAKDNTDRYSEVTELAGMECLASCPTTIPQVTCTGYIIEYKSSKTQSMRYSPYSSTFLHKSTVPDMSYIPLLSFQFSLSF